jgi:3-hydroxyacyl-[acyl-carrier-protein] dehydratase
MTVPQPSTQAHREVQSGGQADGPGVTWATGEASTITVRNRGDVATVAVATVDPADHIFVGHYPGFPVLPGVYLIELADRTARLSLPQGLMVELAAIERTRFLDPVYPGDELTLAVTVSGPADHPLCTVEATTPAGPAAQMRLRYRQRERP